MDLVCESFPPVATVTPAPTLQRVNDDIWRATPRASSLTAVCVVGEARTLIFRPVQDNLAQFAKPLSADLFFVLSSVHTGKWYSVSQYPLPPISQNDLLVAAEQLRATSLTIANDSSPLLESLTLVPAHHQRAMILRWRLCLDEIELA